MTKRDIVVSISVNPSVSGYGGYDEWSIDNVPDNAGFQDALHNFIIAWSQARKLDAGWTGSE